MTGWIIANGQMLLFFAQIAYWFFMVLFVGYAVVQYKRWVNFELGVGRSGQLKGAAGAKADDVAVEEFVE